jgi:hypothetical protein
MDNGKPVWDEALAVRLLGAVVLIGITRREAAGESQEQFFGTVEKADPEGVVIRLGGLRSGETYFLPPDPRAFHPADPGSYRLLQTDEVLENPDYTSTWVVEAGEGEQS